MSYRGSTSSLSGLSSAAALAKAPTPLEQLLEEINFQRTKEMRQLLKDDSGFVMLQGTTYWTDLFVRHFLFQTDHCIDCDDLLFFVRKRHIKSSSRLLPKFDTEVDVFRKASRKLPIGDPDMDWEETVYLNLIIHQFDYTLTLAICTRTSPKELQVLRRHSQKVYASPSRRRMDTKAEVEEMTYPNVCFMVDNFNEVFCDIMVRDGEMVCVELVASDRDGAIQGVIFLGSIRYDALKRVYDARSSLSSKMAQRMTFGLFSNASSQRVEFVRMKGPQGKGHAEMAVTKPKGYSGAETPTSEPGYCATDMWDSDWDSDPEEFFVYRHQRRLSDPSANIQNFVRGGWKTKPAETAGSKARSENEGLDSLANGLNEIEAGDLRDDCEFCVHSISTDASTPMGSDQTCDSAVNSSASVAKSSSKRFTPASSIISSFFPSCKLKSKYPGQAVRCLSQLSELACSTADLVVSEPVEDMSSIKPAASSQLPLIQSTPDNSMRKHPTDFEINCDHVDEDVNKSVKCDEDCSEEDQQTGNIALTDEMCDSFQNTQKQFNDSSDEEFEDCVSSTSECSILSLASTASVKEKSLSESIEEIWSDAEGELISSNNPHQITSRKPYYSGMDTDVDGETPKNFNVSPNKEETNVYAENISHSFHKPSDFATMTNASLIDEKCTKPQEDINSFCDNNDLRGLNFNSRLPEMVKSSSGGEQSRTLGRKVENLLQEEKCFHGVQKNNLCLLCYGLGKKDLWSIHENPYSKEENLLDSKENADCYVLRNCQRSVLRKRNISKEPSTPQVDVSQLHPSTSSCGGLHQRSLDKPKETSSSPNSLPFVRKSQTNMKRNRDVNPPHKVASDGTSIYYWCDVPGGYMLEPQNELDDGAYNPLWTMRGFTQTFHFWKENKRAQSVPLNAFLTYITLPWWSIIRDLLDHRESPILTF